MPNLPEEGAELQFTHESYVQQINHCMEALPDSRKGKNTLYEMRDAGLSTFSTFFMQSPSFLHQQRSMEKKRGISNINTLFGAHKIPSDNQIRNLMDTVSAHHFNPVYRRLFTGLSKSGCFDAFKVLDKQLLLAFDGTEYFSSTRTHCECCSTAQQKNGNVRYYHTAVTPVIVSPNQSQLIPLVPEFITPQDGNDKQDCELNASKRWMDQESE